MLTREQILQILRADLEATRRMREDMRENGRGRTKLYHDMIQECIDLQHFIWMLTDDEYAEKMWTLYISHG